MIDMAALDTIVNIVDISGYILLTTRYLITQCPLQTNRIPSKIINRIPNMTYELGTVVHGSWTLQRRLFPPLCPQLRTRDLLHGLKQVDPHYSLISSRSQCTQPALLFIYHSAA